MFGYILTADLTHASVDLCLKVPYFLICLKCAAVEVEGRVCFFPLKNIVFTYKIYVKKT